VPAAIGAAIGGWLKQKRKADHAKAQITSHFTVPQRLDAFDLVTLLRSMSRSELVELTPAQRNDLQQTITRVETSCFDPSQSELAPDELRRTAQQWVNAASARTNLV